MSEASIRERLRRIRWIHTAGKFCKLFPKIPVQQWMNMRRTRAILRVLPNTMLTAPRLISTYDTVAAVEREGLPGAVVECGVWSGGGTGLMGLASIDAGNTERVFHLFDSFEGMPQPSEKDVGVIDAFRKRFPDRAPAGLDASPGELQAIDTCVGATADEVKAFLTGRLAIASDRIKLHVGWFQDTVPKAAGGIGPLAILRLDGDWYDSTMVCLDHLYDNVVAGGFVIIDDYETYPGCRDAVHDFFEKRGINTACLEHVPNDDCAYFRKP